MCFVYAQTLDKYFTYLNSCFVCFPWIAMTKSILFLLWAYALYIPLICPHTLHVYANDWTLNFPIKKQKSEWNYSSEKQGEKKLIWKRETIINEKEQIQNDNFFSNNRNYSRSRRKNSGEIFVCYLLWSNQSKQS